MSDGLIVPKQIEYVIVKPRRKRFPFAVTVSLLVVAVFVGAVFLARYIMQPQKYPVLQLAEAGLKVSLRTKWVNGSGQYIFLVRPTPGNEARFISVLQTVPRDQLQFDIHLLDADGFEVCSAAPKVHGLLGPDGKPTGMRAEQTFSNCTKEQMRTSSRWHVTYRFPLLGAAINLPPAKPAMSDAVSPHSKITGADFTSGEVETLDAGSFKVLKSAEYMTLLGWKSPDDVSTSCKGAVCVLTNLRTGESVHARRR